MKVFVNGNERDLDAVTLADVARELKLDGAYAIELNRRVVPKTRHAQTRVAPGDRIEIVTLVGGG